MAIHDAVQLHVHFIGGILYNLVTVLRNNYLYNVVLSLVANVLHKAHIIERGNNTPELQFMQ